MFRATIDDDHTIPTEASPMSETDVLTREVEDRICTITLDRPDAMNALDGELVDYLWHTFYELRSDDDVRVVVLTGAGSKAFCAGADLEERREMSDAETKQRIDDYRKCFGAVAELPKPVIGAINGFAFGGGLELALACDIRVVDESTKVGLTETKLGIIPGAGGTQRLPRLIGAARAKELIFSGRRITGERAAELGIANEAVPSGEVLVRAGELAREMVDSAPIALAQAKRAIDAGLQADLRTGLELESRAYEVTLGTEDREEGLEAFREGREPEFEGK
jgi:enoyl-CoA hydratase/carnithine racemase